MQNAVQFTIGSYVGQPEGLTRAQELSRAELRKLLDSLPEDDNVEGSGTATGSDPSL